MDRRRRRRTSPWTLRRSRIPQLPAEKARELPRGKPPATRGGSDERGFSLMEVVVSTVIAVIAVAGLAHSFGIGRAMINRFEVSRAALSAVKARLEILSVSNPMSPDLTAGLHPDPSDPPILFHHLGQDLGTESWTVENWDDPSIPGSPDMRRVTARIVLNEQGVTDTVRLTRLFPR